MRKSLQNLFRREQLTKEAVQNVSFSIEEGKLSDFSVQTGQAKQRRSKCCLAFSIPRTGRHRYSALPRGNDKKSLNVNFPL